ncbi:MAG: PQQ-binding-like beta-propeller repeat protein, partial [Dehalococcoidales bacterium]|nr:PQQ-binding-like beta-propeller repeat protein [Dehalococcoidales bacterium]
MSSQEVERLQSHDRHRRTLKAITNSLITLGILAVVAFPILYFTTDIIARPSQEVNSNSLPGEWAMFRHDPGHTGAAGASSILPQGKIKWVFTTNSNIHSSPVVADGNVYIGARDNKLYALDTATGTQRWAYETGSWVETSPAIANGVVYIGSNDGKLYALDAHSGAKLWDFPTRYPITSSPAVAGGIVYCGSDDYYLYALDATKGTNLWNFDTLSLVASSPVVANGIVYVGSSDELSYALNALNGRLRLHFKTLFPVFAAPAVSDGTVYFITDNGRLFAVNGSARNWPYEHEIRPYWTQLWLMSVPLIPAPTPQSGLLWQLNLGKKVTSSPVIADATLYIAADDKLLAIDLQSRQNIWEFKPERAIRVSPAVANGIVYT